MQKIKIQIAIKSKTKYLNLIKDYFLTILLEIAVKANKSDFKIKMHLFSTKIKIYRVIAKIRIK
jgi:hypothetical protein